LWGSAASSALATLLSRCHAREIDFVHDDATLHVTGDGRRWCRSICAVALASVGASCGFFPFNRTSLVGTTELEGAPKPLPLDSAFEGCGEAGSQPDYALNRLKNRVDEGTYIPVPWSVLARLPWPRRVGYRFRHQWTQGETKDVKRFEGAAVELEGYLAGFKREIPEPPNCYSTVERHKDFHLWLAEHEHGDKRRSVVVEITPRVRAAHPNWDKDHLSALVSTQVRMRVHGWLMLDQMHPEDVGGNRATLWEVHPVMAIEWLSSSGQWIALDSLSPK